VGKFLTCVIVVVLGASGVPSAISRHESTRRLPHPLELDKRAIQPIETLLLRSFCSEISCWDDYALLSLRALEVLQAACAIGRHDKF
jgi:hypothetical protein